MLLELAQWLAKDVRLLGEVTGDTTDYAALQGAAQPYLDHVADSHNLQPE